MTTEIEVLTEFVRQSNMIEMEPTEPGHPLFDDHLVMAQLIDADPSTWVSSPLSIHSYLMSSQLSCFPGELRQLRVQVGGNEKMSPIRVREEFPKLIDTVLVGPDTLEGVEAWVWGKHDHFEHIHPFVDGNGRTGRLWMNALRLVYDLPWFTVTYNDRFKYYRAIEEWESING